MVLNVHGLSVPLVDTAFGPLPSFEDPDLQSLAFALQWAVEGRIPDFRQAVEQRLPVGRYPVVAEPPGPNDDLTAASEKWRRLTGHELGDDVYVVSTGLGLPDVALPREALLDLIAQLEQLRESRPQPPGPWLFREVPIWHAPAHREEDALRLLEHQAEELERIVRSPRAEDARPREAAKRRFLMIELNALGILSAVGYDDKERWLQTWALPLTLGYLQAARKLHFYFGSAGRRRYFPDAKDEHILGGRVSPDWFRHPPSVLSRGDPDEFLGFCEHTLSQSQVSGYEGTLLVRQGGPWYEIAWRQDDGEHPAVVSARLRG